jgi:hypothetical protein
LNLPLIRPPAMPAALLRTIQNWQHWKDVRERAGGAVAHAVRSYRAILRAL